MQRVTGTRAVVQESQPVCVSLYYSAMFLYTKTNFCFYSVPSEMGAGSTSTNKQAVLGLLPTAPTALGLGAQTANHRGCCNINTS